MRTVASWALAIALGALAAAATVDALRAEHSAREAGPAPLRQAELPRARESCVKAVPASFRGEGGLVPCERRHRAPLPRV